VSQPHTRKTFLAKVLGALAFTGLIAPRLLANPASASGSDSAPAVKASFSVKTDPRSVARADDVV
jgi:hypothetical protein